MTFLSHMLLLHEIPRRFVHVLTCLRVGATTPKAGMIPRGVTPLSRFVGSESTRQSSAASCKPTRWAMWMD